MKARYWLWESLKLTALTLSLYVIFGMSMMWMSDGINTAKSLIGWYESMIAAMSSMIVYQRQASFVISIGATRKQTLRGMGFMRGINLIALMVLSGFIAYSRLTFEYPLWIALLMKAGLVLCGMGFGTIMGAICDDGGVAYAFALIVLSALMGILSTVLLFILALAPVVIAWTVFGAGIMAYAAGGIVEANVIQTHVVR